jgi:hypothetical protein
MQTFAVDFNSAWFRMGVNLAWLAVVLFPLGSIVRDPERACRLRRRLLPFFLVPYLVALYLTA